MWDIDGWVAIAADRRRSRQTRLAGMTRLPTVRVPAAVLRVRMSCSTRLRTEHTGIAAVFLQPALKFLDPPLELLNHIE